MWKKYLFTPGAAAMRAVALGAWMFTAQAAWGQGGAFSAQPGWITGPTDSTLSVALGDVDGDGDLDLVCGNRSASGVALYLNSGDTFGVTPAWSSGSRATTVLLADIDNDGDLDLVCEYEQRTRLYRNSNGVFSLATDWQGPRVRHPVFADVDGDGDLDLLGLAPASGAPGPGPFRAVQLYANDGGTFGTSPRWTSRPGYTEDGITLGDVDGDGDLDLFYATTGRDDSTALYLNQGGSFGTTPAWTAKTGYTYNMALGDVDGDGDLDLVCGNGNAIGSRLYLNEGGRFGTDPVWTSEPNWAFTVALGDVDGDGDLDLVCGSEGGSTLYLNSDGTFGATPAWSAQPHLADVVIALGDVDGDGDLDLVEGRSDESSALYFNQSGAFAAVPAWSSGSGSSMVALGDVNGDDSPDLVCAHYGDPIQGATLYFNHGDSFDLTPAWTSVAAHTAGLALGDVNGDGGLDLVCGNNSRYAWPPSALYLNVGGTFSATPSRTLAAGAGVTGVALGDIDGDGDLDLVLGKGAGDSTALYMNVGGTFADRPAWSGLPAGSVALGDVDGDGDLDLVCSVDTGVVVYLNTGGVLTTGPTWMQAADYVYRVVLGDVDGDGDLDLLCGPAAPNGSVKLYRNDGHGNFGSAPAWSSAPENGQSDVALADVDGDADLDLVLTGYGCQVYLNTGGIFGTNPVWLSPILGEAGDSQGGEVAVHDVDGDGDLDLVGLDYQFIGTTVFQGVASPPFKGDPTAPTRQLPNNDAFLRSVRFRKLSKNTYRVHATAVDVESDPVRIVAEYQFRGEPPWKPMDVVGGSVALGPWTTSPAGIEHEFDWDVRRVRIDNRPVVLRLRTISNAGRVGVVQHVASYRKEVGSLEVSRPVIQTSSTRLVLPAVTLGDSISASVSISNGGNDTLRVASIELLDPALRVDASAFVLAPESHLDRTLTFVPSMAGESVGFMLVRSDDPFTPVDSVRIEVQALGLSVTTQPQVPPGPVPLGEAVSVQVIPAHLVRIEGGVLRYRSPGDASFESKALNRVGSAFVATIPGPAVRETGVEYYVEVRNSDYFATDPPAGPSAPFTLVVQRPEEITVNPRPNSRSEFLAGREIQVDVLMPQGTRYEGGAIHYRQGGARSFSAESLEVDARSGQPVATIAATSVGPRGVEYWVEVQTATSGLRFPAVQHPEASPDTIRTLVPLLAEGPQSAPPLAGRYRLVSIPLDFPASFTGTLEAMLSDQREFGPYNRKHWRAFRYLPEESANAELVDRPGVFRPQPGRAFWLIGKDAARIDTSPIDGFSTPTGKPYPIVMAPGWNPFGNPFAFPVAWDTVTSIGKPAALQYLKAFDSARGTIGGYSDIAPTVLQPFEGYFLFNGAPQAETLLVRPVEASSTSQPALANGAPAAKRPGARLATLGDWEMRLEARSQTAYDGSVAFGVVPGASDEHDALDEPKPPSPPGPWIALGFAHSDWANHARLYARDLRAPDAEGHVFEMEVRSAVREEIVLAPGASAVLPKDLVVRIVDREQGTSEDLLRAGGAPSACRILSYGADRPYRLSLLAGTAAFVDEASQQLTAVPSRIVLDQNSPNPFNATTRIRFGLPAPERVTLEIYNVRGERVATLLQGELRPAGYHSVVWNGTNRAGRLVASGVYLFRLRAGDKTLVRRLAVLK